MQLWLQLQLGDVTATYNLDLTNLDGGYSEDDDEITIWLDDSAKRLITMTLEEWDALKLLIDKSSPTTMLRAIDYHRDHG